VRSEKYLKKLAGRRDIQDALGRLDRLTQEEVRMAAAQGLKATHDVDDHVQQVDDKVQGIEDKVQQVADHIDDQKRKSSNILISESFTRKA
jgi:transcription initiation factor IIF auxiliary subunit